jgi:hypothetical protein
MVLAANLTFWLKTRGLIFVSPGGGDKLLVQGRLTGAGAGADWNACATLLPETWQQMSLQGLGEARGRTPLPAMSAGFYLAPAPVFMRGKLFC